MMREYLMVSIVVAICLQPAIVEKSDVFFAMLASLIWPIVLIIGMAAS